METHGESNASRPDPSSADEPGKVLDCQICKSDPAPDADFPDLIPPRWLVFLAGCGIGILSFACAMPHDAGRCLQFLRAQSNARQELAFILPLLVCF
jgi:hypothetical protein